MAKLDISPQKYYFVTCLPQSGRYLIICGPSRFVAGMLLLTTVMDASEADVQLEDFGEY